MKLNNTWHYLAVVAMLGMGACSSSRQAAQNAGEVDDLYGNSGDAAVYAGDDRKTTQQDVRQATRFDRRQSQQRGSNVNPDYMEGQQGATGTDSEYYTELSARQVQRGISPDPGWGATDAYASGYANGYNQGLYGANSWNRWGLGNAGFVSGLSLGIGFGSAFGYSPFGYSPFGYSPYAYGSYGYSPFGYGGFYDPFYSSYAYGIGGYGYSPFGYGGYGGYGYNPYAYGGYYGGTTVINNNYITGADPYRNNRTYGPRGTSSSARYSGDFNNTAPSYNGGRRTGSYGSAYNNSSTGDGTYYTNPSSGRGSSRGSGSYSNSATPSGGRTYGNSAGSYAPSTGATGTYYERPSSRQGSYNQSYSSGGGSSRGNYSQPSQSAPSYARPSQPSYQQSQPTYQQPSRSYSAPTPSYSAPSYSAPSSGGGGGGGYSSGSGSSRGPR
ncbi:hypothetical protein [Fibrella arboris]|uniref:hypothetical protein n=1 Tax=Fibrella arboris TaxID=3242486 RepID=UPI0035220A88